MRFSSVERKCDNIWLRMCVCVCFPVHLLTFWHTILSVCKWTGLPYHKKKWSWQLCSFILTASPFQMICACERTIMAHYYWDCGNVIWMALEHTEKKKSHFSSRFFETKPHLKQPKRQSLVSFWCKKWKKNTLNQFTSKRQHFKILFTPLALDFLVEIKTFALNDNSIVYFRLKCCYVAQRGASLHLCKFSKWDSNTFWFRYIALVSVDVRNYFKSIVKMKMSVKCK